MALVNLSERERQVLQHQRSHSLGFPFDQLQSIIEWLLLNVVERPVARAVKSSLNWLQKMFDNRKKKR
jgi:hypothetical protein